MIDIVKLARGYVFDDVHRTHYEGCESEHVSCLMRKLADEIERRDEWREWATAEIERLHADNQAAVIAYAAEINEAKAESERLRADAERYRWLRDHGVTYVICRYEKGGDVEHDWCGWLPLDTRETDAAIDAAMKEKP